MLTPGKYRAVPVAAALGYTLKGNEQIAVMFETLDPAGERITWYGFFTDKTTDRTLQSLRYCGWAGADLSDFCEEQLPAGFDKEVELDVQNNEWEGKIRLQVAWVNAPGGGAVVKSALTKEQAKAFGARMKATIVALDKESGRAQTAPEKPNGPSPARAAQRSTAKRAGLADVPQEVLDQQAQDVPY